MKPVTSKHNASTRGIPRRTSECSVDEDHLSYPPSFNGMGVVIAASIRSAEILGIGGLVGFVEGEGL
jgi:hypothetical protein